MRVRAGPTHGHKRDTCVAVALLVMAGLIGACSAAGPTSNGVGDSVTRPAPVLSLPVIGGTEVTASWTAPDTNLVVSGYELRWRLDSPSDSPWNSPPVDSTVTTHTISGLDPGTTYRIQVRAVYADDVGDWSEPLIVTTEGSAEMTPTVGPPVVTTEEAVTTTTVTVGWTPPQTTLEISGYELRWRTSGGAWTDVDIPQTDTSHSIIGLNPGMDYEIQVRAVFAEGVGGWSQPLIARTDTAGSTPQQPPQPTIVAPTLATGAVGPTSVTVTWTLPPTTLAVLRFELRWKPSAENDWPDDVVDIPSTDSSHTIIDLDFATEYAVQVRAVFASDEGPWSTSVMPSTEPEPPTVTIEAVQATYVEGVNQVWFRLNFNFGSESPFRVRVNFTETGGANRLISDSNSANIHTGSLAVTVPARVRNNNRQEPESVITATIRPGTGFTVGSRASAMVTMIDDD